MSWAYCEPKSKIRTVSLVSGPAGAMMARSFDLVAAPFFEGAVFFGPFAAVFPLAVLAWAPRAVFFAVWVARGRAAAPLALARPLVPFAAGFFLPPLRIERPLLLVSWSRLFLENGFGHKKRNARPCLESCMPSETG